ncbi:MAG TPA: redoxin domain-containing protein [Bacillota bacterium]
MIGFAILVLFIGIFIFNTLGPNDESEKQQNEQTANSPNHSEEQAGIKVGEQAPDFELETLDGETTKLSDLKGKKVILNFWATWCPPCQKEMPEMQQFYEEHHEEIEIIAVNLTGSESKASDVNDYIEEHEYTFPVLLDRDLAVRDEYMALVVPTTYFIGTDGIVQEERKVGPMTYELMEEMLQSLD